MTSTWFRINANILIEYIYNYSQYSTSNYPFKKITNSYRNSILINNTVAAQNVTRNVTDYSTAELNDHRVVLLGDDTAYYYPNVDSNIVDSAIVFSPQQTVNYDCVRVHLLSGYNVDDYDGFLLNFYLKTKKSRVLSLADHVTFKGNPDNLFYAPLPKRISGDTFDKYIEFLIPSTYSMIQEQLTFPASLNSLAYKFSEGEMLDESGSIYCQLSFLKDLVEENGNTYATVEHGEKFVFSSVDEFDLLSADITENTNGYFEYCAKWDGNLIEDFIFSLNSLAGNNYHIVHELDFYEQVGPNNLLVDSITVIQVDRYDSVKRIRPVLVNGSDVTTVSVDYRVRLINTANGSSIVKNSSVTSLNPTYYSEGGLKLNVGEASQPIAVFNKVAKNSISVKSDILPALKVQTAYVYVNNNDLSLKESGNIIITPFDNTFRFSIERIRDTESFELDVISNYYMVFVNNDNTKLYVPEMLSNATKKSEGELMFKMSEENSKKVLTFGNNSFYIIAKGPTSIESNIVSGKWWKSNEELVVAQTTQTTATQTTQTTQNTQTGGARPTSTVQDQNVISLTTNPSKDDVLIKPQDNNANPGGDSAILSD